MRAWAIDALLAVAVLAGWLGAFGSARLRAPLDRLHGVAFVNWTLLPALAAAAFVADGASGRAFKLLLLAVLSVLTGAATSHATGRALVARETDGGGGA